MPSASRPLGFARAESLTLCYGKSKGCKDFLSRGCGGNLPLDMAVWANSVATLYHTIERSFILIQCAHFCEHSQKSISHSLVSDSATPWTGAHRAPLSMKFSRQE